MNKGMIRRLEALYRLVPKVNCQQKCQAACGPIAMSGGEHRRIVERTGEQPTCHNLTCSLLNEQGQCSVYDIRPAICRLYGVTPQLRCPFGCQPEVWWTNMQGHEWITRVIEASGGKEVWIATAEQIAAQLGVDISWAEMMLAGVDKMNREDKFNLATLRQIQSLSQD
jgi:hypothetical protein